MPQWAVRRATSCGASAVKRQCHVIAKYSQAQLLPANRDSTSSDATASKTTTARHSHPASAMSQFRAKKLDISCFINVRVLRDHTKRKVFEHFETQRCAHLHPMSIEGSSLTVLPLAQTGKLFAMQSEIPLCRRVCAPRRSSN